jgi:DNA-directed RNA polymerase specialized sigma24 family protein
MAKNRILDRIRHAKIGPGAGVSPNSFTHSHDKPPHDKLVDKERGERLVRNVESNLKNSKSREVFVLWMHGFTAKEIADILGVDVLSIYRMKRQIREVVFLIVENDFES